MGAAARQLALVDELGGAVGVSATAEPDLLAGLAPLAESGSPWRRRRYGGRSTTRTPAVGPRIRVQPVGTRAMTVT
ncbi:hypothetical protein [Nocardia stercoris]|uniref:Uncharacterized protein n=1 Tax=Nocardia stercoris TaxID=2483361 RepID=A0A3M2L3Q7_9NOCA|nr:hypothetical protein [Nocardia stercoris]RMI32349.1 hypothetical protein EBN03_15385 [Nocardia stercoris]